MYFLSCGLHYIVGNLILVQTFFCVKILHVFLLAVYHRPSFGSVLFLLYRIVLACQSCNTIIQGFF